MLFAAAVDQLFLMTKPELMFGLSGVITFANCSASEIAMQQSRVVLCEAVEPTQKVSHVDADSSLDPLECIKGKEAELAIECVERNSVLKSRAGQKMVFSEYETNGLGLRCAERVPIAAEAVVPDFLKVTDRAGIIADRKAAIL